MSIQASSSGTVGGNRGQIVVRRDRGRSGKLTLGLRSRGTSDPNGHGVDGESPDGEEYKSSFEEHDDMERHQA